MTNFGVKSLLIACLVLPLHVLSQSNDFDRSIELFKKGKVDTAAIIKCLQTGEEYLDRPESREEDMNAAFLIADQMEVASRQINYPRGLGLSHLLRAKTFRESGHADNGVYSSREAIRYLDKYGTISERAQAVAELGGTYSNDDNTLPIKIQLYEQAISLYRQNGNELKVAQLEEFTGDLLQLHNEYPKAEKILLDALSLYKKTGYPRLQGVYSVLGNTYHGASDFVQALHYNMLAVQTGEKLGEQTQLMTSIYNRVGLIYYVMKYYDQAIEYFGKSLAHARLTKDTIAIQGMLLNLADGYRNRGEYRRSLDTVSVLGKFGPLKDKTDIIQVSTVCLKDYIALNEPDKAAASYEKLKSLLDDENSNNILGLYIRLGIIQYLQYDNQFKETIGYLKDYNRILKKIKLPLVRKIDGAYYTFRTDSALGNWQEALIDFQEYKLYSDSLTTINKTRELGILRLQFETDKKDQDIELLTQKSKLQEISLQKGKAFRNVIIGGICMLLLVLALVYNRYRLKKKTTFKLEKQQEEINEQNTILKKLLDEKEWLLKEIHHRVKNNLQIIISLLNTQSQYLDNIDAIAAIKNSQHRMYAMSLIHQRLYHTDNLGAIDMNWYIRELIGFMKESFDTGTKISFKIDSEPIMLDVVQAIPLGLILNESVSNSIKYAFPGSRKGTITIVFKRNKDGMHQLSISDDGAGLNKEVPEESASLGMSLMKGLSEQLDASFNLNSSDNGVSVQIVFLTRSISDGN